MTCFNPKHVSYKYGLLPTKTQIKYRSDIDNNGKPIYKYKSVPLYDKNKKPLMHIAKIIKFTTREQYKKSENDKIGTGYTMIPCGKCIGCLLDKAKEWGLRGLLESKQWKYNCFITLTYNNKWLPKDHNLHKKEIQNFLKRLRKAYPGIESRIWKNKEEYPIRYFYSGEYGSEEYTMRPHFHIGIFNWKPTDLKFFKFNDYGDPIYTSEQVSKIWSNPEDNTDRKGFITVEDMNFNTAQYIARYTAKKLFSNHDEKIKAKGLNKEFIETSRRGGLAYQIQEQPKEWKKMKRNYGFFEKDKKGNLKLMKIPNFLKNKWKKENQLEYFELSDNHAKQTQESTMEKLKKTGYTIEEYLKIQKRTLIEKLKNAKTLKRNRIKRRI